jgi:hypothetical protein
VSLLLLFALLVHPLTHAFMASRHHHGGGEAALECPLCTPAAPQAGPALPLLLEQVCLPPEVFAPEAPRVVFVPTAQGRAPPLTPSA